MNMDLEHAERLTAVEERAKSNTKRLDEVEAAQKDLGALVASVNALAIKEENVEKDVKEIKGDVKELAGKGGRRWDSVIDKIITVIVAAVVTYALSKLGI